MTGIRTTVLAVAALVLAGCSVGVGTGDSGDPTSPVAAPSARSVVERFAAALETMDCEGLFATTTTSARDDLGVTWVNVEECENDRQSGGDQAAESVDVVDVTEAGATSASGELRMNAADGTVIRFALELVRIGSADWVISDIQSSFDQEQEPSPNTGTDDDARESFLFIAEDFLNALAARDCYAVQIVSTKEFWKEFAASAGADDICDAVENGTTAAPVELTVVDHSVIDEGAPDQRWGELNLTYTFEYQGGLWDQPLEFGYWHEEGAPGTAGHWKIVSFRSTGDPVPQR